MRPVMTQTDNQAICDGVAVEAEVARVLYGDPASRRGVFRTSRAPRRDPCVPLCGRPTRPPGSGRGHEDAAYDIWVP